MTTTTTNKPNHAKSKTNPLVQLLSSLQKQPHEEPYLLLVQYSRSFAQRQTCASSAVDVAVYQRASVLTPAQRAQRDAAYNEWFSEIINLITTRMVWVETIGASRRAVVEKSNKTVVISAAQDPLGWDDDDSAAMNQKDLHQLATTILQSATTSDDDDQTVIVFESLLPLVTLHGMDRTVDFLRYLMKQQQASSSSTTLIVPIMTEALTPSQHVVLEDVAHAVLMLQGGEATLLRRGVRERANLLREAVPFTLDDDEGLQLLSPADEAIAAPKDVIKKEDIALVEESSVPARQGRPGKVTLRHEEDGEKPKQSAAAAPKPQIYLQDDDPEFDDMDEEDPDDDLDL